MRFEGFRNYRTLLWILLVAGVCSNAFGFELTDRFAEGRWRLEMAGTLRMWGTGDRYGDKLFYIPVDYEWPIFNRYSLSVRFHPAILYYEENDDTHGDDGWIYGAGAGLVLRGYQHAESRTGIFLEAAGTPFWHSQKLESNAASVNLLTQLGVGYQWVNQWHTIFRFDHISNGNTRRPNGGTNGISLGLGYSF